MASDQSDDDLPRAYVARVPSPAAGKVSAVLVPRSMGFLAVQLLFEGVPAVARQVQFFECSDDTSDDGPSRGPCIEWCARIFRRSWLRPSRASRARRCPILSAPAT